MALIMVLAGAMVIVRGMLQHQLVRYLQQKTVGEGYLLMVRLTFELLLFYVECCLLTRTCLLPEVRLHCMRDNIRQYVLFH